MSSFQSATIRVTSVALAISLAYWLKKRSKRVDDIEKNEALHPTDVTIGSRGFAAISPPLTYLNSFFKCLQDPYDPHENREGYIALCIAENKIVTDLLAERLMQHGTATTAFSDSQVYCYGSFLGLPIAREAIAYFLTKRFLCPNDASMTPEQTLEQISPTHVALGAGGAALINYLFYILGEKGDCCLIPAPYYAAFESDMRVIAGCVPYALEMANPAKGPTTSDLDLAFIAARSKGMRVKFILLTNPNNPLGVIYKPQVVSDVITWARKRKLHTIVDEIYALSVHEKPYNRFQSVIRVLDNKLGDDVHHIWALSKDFGASGFRVGTLYTQNEKLLMALANLNIFSGVSHPMQMITAELLTDDIFVDNFLDAARERLRHSFTLCVKKLEEMVLPYVHAEAGLYIYVNFSALIPTKDFKGEAELHELFTNYARVVLTPGESQRDNRPGHFRICYAWVAPEVLGVAMERLSRLVAKIRKMDWSDLNGASLESILQV